MNRHPHLLPQQADSTSLQRNNTMDDDAPPSPSGPRSSAQGTSSSSTSTANVINTMTKSSTSYWIGASDRNFPGLSDPPSQDGKSFTPSNSSTSSSTPFFFATLADTQLGAINDNTSWEDEKELCRLAVQKLNQLKPRPRFAIVCGDLVHHFPGMYPDTDPGIRDKQVADFKAIMGEVHPAIPLLCVCGNHDVGNRPTASSIQTFKKDFGDDFFVFWIDKMKGIVLNTNVYFDPSEARDEYSRQHAWFRTELAMARAQGARHILLFGHHPLFLFHDDEDESEDVLGSSSFNTKAGERITIPNTYFHLPRARREEILELMRQHGSSHFFCGHWHQNGVVPSEKYRMENVITSAVGLQIGHDKSGFRLVKVFDDAIVHKYFGFEEMPSQIPLGPKEKEAW